jgi:hypothetical protein
VSRRDEERRHYEGDVAYEVWRNGGNVDAIDYDRVWDGYYGHRAYDEAAAMELRAQRRRQSEWPSKEPQP